MSSLVLPDLAAFFGWASFVLWSISFYPQVVVTFFRKDVSQLSTHFVLTNLTGHSAYLVYTYLLYFSPTIREQSSTILDPDSGSTCRTVEVNDLFFTVNAVTLTFISALQVFWYGKRELSGTWRRVVLYCVLVVVWTLGLCFLVLGATRTLPWPVLLFYLSLVKIIVTAYKYLPQVILLYQSKSTLGWSNTMVVLDLLGGVGSLCQQGLLTLYQTSCIQFTNIPKTALALLSILYDVVLFSQYVWYNFLKPEKPPLGDLERSTESLAAESTPLFSRTSSDL